MTVIGRQDNSDPIARQINWRNWSTWCLGVAVLSGILFGPLGLPLYAAGFLKSYLLSLLVLFGGLIGWAALWLAGGIQLLRDLRGRRRAIGVRSSMFLIVPLVFALFAMGVTPYPIAFEDGLIGRLQIRMDVQAVQMWVESLDPNDCRDDRHVNPRGRNLAREQLPQVLECQDGMVSLELDAEGRPRVRLSWFEGKAGEWGLVIGRKDMRTPPSDRDMYGERRSELRPGVYFWYVES